MKNSELAEAFKATQPGTKVFVVNPGIEGSDYEQFAIGAVTYLTNSDPVDTIIEASRERGTIEVEEFLRGVLLNDPDGDAQVFVREWEGQGFAYFDIKEVRKDPLYPAYRSLVLGDWRCGG